MKLTEINFQATRKIDDISHANPIGLTDFLRGFIKHKRYPMGGFFTFSDI
jgi:hypothetical protein